MYINERSSIANDHKPAVGQGFYCPVPLHRGTLVTFTLPHATKKELFGRARGIVLTTGLCSSTIRPMICPVLEGESEINQAVGIRVVLPNVEPRYLRPDLATTLDRVHGQIDVVKEEDTGAACLYPEALVRAACDRLIEIITPSPQKFAQLRHGFLAYGEMGWADAVPRSNEAAVERAPILNLTPPEIYCQTGMVQIVRAYSHLERFRDNFHLMMPQHRWFDTGFFNLSEIFALPFTAARSLKPGWKPIGAGNSALKGCAKKIAGLIDPAAEKDVNARYSSVRGKIPAKYMAQHGPLGRARL